MTDIVDRARSPEFADVAAKYLLAECAEEIERLRARLVKYQDCDTMINQELKDVRANNAKLRKALYLADEGCRYLHLYDEAYEEHPDSPAP